MATQRDGHRPKTTRPSPSVLAAVALGGALGAPARYGVAQVVGVRANGFPWATFVTNVSGSAALGFLFVLLGRRFASHHVRAFLATGFLGAYTTYSTFAVETDLLADHGHVAVAGTYVVVSVLVGVAAVWAGMALARAVTPARP